MASDILDNHQNLGVNHTEFFVLHRDDPLVPIGNVVTWLNQHKDGGRIDVFGGSNFHHYRIKAANEYAKANGLQGFSVSSPNFSLALPNEPMWDECLTLDRAGRDFYEESQFPIFSWSSAGGGFFARVDSPDVRRVYHNTHNFARLERADEFSKRLGISPNAVALAWALNQPMNLFALIGPDSAAQLEDNLTALEITLDADELQYLEFGSSKSV
jgi:aryl-alcohol dehydrogenase-like predicted oxidoreductase